MNTMEITSERIRELTTTFCRVFKEFGGQPSDLKNVSIVLFKGDGYWSLVAKQKGGFNRRKYVTVIDLPDDIAEEPLDEALVDLAAIIATKLSASARAINSNEKRGAETRSRIARAANRGRWGKE